MATHPELTSSSAQPQDIVPPPDPAQVLLAVARMIAAYRTGRYDDVSLPTLTLAQLTASILSYRDRFGIWVFDKGSPLRSEQTLVELLHVCVHEKLRQYLAWEAAHRAA